MFHREVIELNWAQLDHAYLAILKIDLKVTRPKTYFGWGNQNHFVHSMLRKDNGMWVPRVVEFSVSILIRYHGESHGLSPCSPFSDSQKLLGGLEPWNFMTFHILRMSSSQLTNSIIFQRDRLKPPTSNVLGFWHITMCLSWFSLGMTAFTQKAFWNAVLNNPFWKKRRQKGNFPTKPMIRVLII